MPNTMVTAERIQPTKLIVDIANTSALFRYIVVCLLRFLSLVLLLCIINSIVVHTHHSLLPVILVGLAANSAVVNLAQGQTNV